MLFRSLNSKWGGAVQSFQHVRVHLAEHSSGMFLRSAECLSSFPRIREDINKFSLAAKGSELLLHFLHDTEPNDPIFFLAREYFECCERGESSLLFSVFQLALLSELGLLPSFEERKDLSFALHKFLTLNEPLTVKAARNLSSTDERVLTDLCEHFLHDHLSFPLRSVAASASIATNAHTLTRASA